MLLASFPMASVAHASSCVRGESRRIAVRAAPVYKLKDTQHRSMVVGRAGKDSEDVSASSSENIDRTDQAGRVGKNSDDVSGASSSESALPDSVPDSCDSLPDSRPDARERSVPDSSGSAVPDSLPTIGVDTDWRAFRAKLVAGTHADGGEISSQEWAHSIPVPERGAVLLAHPMMFNESQKYFYKAVILLLKHDESGSYGVILNRPSKYTLGEVQGSNQPLTGFESCRLWIGGDVGDNQLLLVHKEAGLEGSVEVVKGIHVGGTEEARSKVAAGALSASQFRWFVCYSGWGPGQLEAECKRGTWYPCAASPDMVMCEPTEKDGTDLYYKMLELMGGDYEVLAKKLKPS